MTLVPIFIMAASSGPDTGRGVGAASLRDSSSTVAEPPWAPAHSSSSALSVLGPAWAKNDNSRYLHQTHPNTVQH